MWQWVLGKNGLKFLRTNSVHSGERGKKQQTTRKALFFFISCIGASLSLNQEVNVVTNTSVKAMMRETLKISQVSKNLHKSAEICIFWKLSDPDFPRLTKLLSLLSLLTLFWVSAECTMSLHWVSANSPLSLYWVSADSLLCICLVFTDYHFGYFEQIRFRIFCNSLLFLYIFGAKILFTHHYTW